MVISRIGRAYRTAYSGLSREVWMLSTVLLINRCGAMVLLFLSLYLSNVLHFDKHQIGVLIGGFYGCGAIAGSLIGGRLSQRLGPIRVQVISLALTAPGYLLVVQLRHFWLIAVALAFLSVASEMLRPASVTAVTLFSEPRNHQRALGLNRLALNLGTAFGGAIGGILAGLNYSLLFYANTLGVVVSLIATVWFFGWGGRPVTLGRQDRVTPLPAVSPLRDKAFLAFLLMLLLASIVFFQLLSTFPLYLDEVMGLRETHIGLLMAVNTMLIVVFEMLLLQAVRKRDKLKLIAIGQFLACLGFGLLPFGQGFAFVALTVVVWTVGEMLAMPISAAWVASRSDARNRGDYMGLYVTCYAVAFVIAPLVGTWLYSRWPDGVWYAALLVGVLIGGGYWWLSIVVNKSSVDGEPPEPLVEDHSIAADEESVVSALEVKRAGRLNDPPPG